MHKTTEAKIAHRAATKPSALSNMIANLRAMEVEGVDLRPAIGRPDLPTHLLFTPVSFIHASATDCFGYRTGAERASNWLSETLTVGGLFALCAFRDEYSKKDERGIALMTLKPGECARQQELAEAWTGVAFDDDNHQAIGRDVIAKPGGPLRCSFSTASDGKSADTFSLSSYNKYVKSNPGTPMAGKASDRAIADFLNHKKQGQPYRGVEVIRTPGGLPNVLKINGEYHVGFTMEAQTRTRSLVPFAAPIEGELLSTLQSRGLIKAVCEAIEHDIFGTTGHDEKTKTVNAVAFLPAGNRREYFYQVLGDAYLYDAVPTALRVLAENPPRPKRTFVPVASSGHSRGLRGLLLATMIEERFPELMRGTKTNPLVLDRCPFADGHSSKRGEADGSAFVYDADPERTSYPVVKCHHDSCSGYRTKDFVNEMIRNGDLPADIHQDQDYRIELE